MTVSSERKKLIVRTRVFAFLLHALVKENNYNQKKGKQEEISYLIQLALTLGKVCVEEADLDGARLGLHKVADYIERLQSIQGGDEGQRIMLEAEYLIMRTALVG